MLPGDLLQWLSLGQKSGTLALSNQVVEKKIFFQKGRVISSASNDPREYLGQFLMSHGYITEPELKKAMEVQQQSGILLGKILVMIDVISEEDLVRLMRLKAEEEIYDIFLWKEGEFFFIDDELPTMAMIPLQVDVTGLIMEGMRRFDEWGRMREIIPSDDYIPQLEKAVEIPGLDAARRIVVSAIDGRRSIADIVLESRSSSFIVSETLFALAHAGAVKIIDPATLRAPERQEAPVAAGFDEDDEIVSMLARAQSSLRKKEFEKALRLLKAAQNLDPNNEKVRTALRGTETVILGELRKEGISESAVPRVAKPLEAITDMNFSPNEGFILSRINGTWDISSLIKISPIREADAMLIFYKLHRDGIITFS